MNVDNLNQLIEAIKTGNPYPHIGFNMQVVFKTPDDIDDLRCYKVHTERTVTSVACLGAWAALLHSNEVDPINWIDQGADYLDISMDEAIMLFRMSDVADLHFDDEDITVEDTIQVLEHFRDTGNINWPSILVNHSH